MAAAKDKKLVSAFTGHMEQIEAVYDFAKDGGAIGVIDLIEMKHAAIIHSASVKVLTSVTSAGAATVEMGVAGGDTDAILPAQLQAALVAPKGFDSDAAGKGLYVASGGKVAAEIKVAALTAGKLSVVLFVSKF